MSEEKVLVVGLGEIGGPLAEILSTEYQVFTKDVGPLDLNLPVDVMHVCYPFLVDDFVRTTVEYIAQYQPDLTVIHSTVVPGTTSAVHLNTQRPVAYSPVRGKHTMMKEHLLSYTKFVGAGTPEATKSAMEHLKGAGMKVDSFSSPEALELSKLLETSYFGLLIAWAQEQERYCIELKVDYNEVMRFNCSKEMTDLPPVVFQPGFIGGHCVIANTYLLEQVQPSQFIESIRVSNDRKRDEWLKEGKMLDVRLAPIMPGSYRKETT